MKINYPTTRKRRDSFAAEFHMRNGYKVIGKKDDLQECKDCHKIFPTTEFTLKGTCRPGVYYTRKSCRECLSILNREVWIIKKNAPPKPERCECCHIKGKKLQADHIHGTTVFRGWLCSSCNTAIGLFGDNLKGVIQAAIFLENNTEKIIETLHEVFTEMFARTK